MYKKWQITWFIVCNGAVVFLLILSYLDERDKRILAEQPFTKVEMVNNGQIHEYQIDNDRIKLIRGEK